MVSSTHTSVYTPIKQCKCVESQEVYCLNRINQRRLWQELDADVNKLLLQRRKSNNWNSLKVFILPINSEVITICSQKQKSRRLLYIPILKMCSCSHIYKLKWKSSHEFEIVWKLSWVNEKNKKVRIQVKKWEEERWGSGKGDKRWREALVKLCLARGAIVWLWTTTFLCPEVHSFKTGKKTLLLSLKQPDKNHHSKHRTKNYI